MPLKIHIAFAKLWPWVFGVFMLLALANFVLSVIGMNSFEAQQAILVIAGLLFFPILASVFFGFSYDISKRLKKDASA